MSKRNRVRYKSQGNPYPTITMTGTVFLRHVDEEAMKAAFKGDLQVYLSTDSLTYNTHVGDYEAMGYEGYLKAEVFDGKKWNLMSLEEFFPGRDYYFGKRERPIDTFTLCVAVLKAAAGTELMRTYREHYVKVPQRMAEEE